MQAIIFCKDSCAIMFFTYIDVAKHTLSGTPPTSTNHIRHSIYVCKSHPQACRHLMFSTLLWKILSNDVKCVFPAGVNIFAAPEARFLNVFDIFKLLHV